MSVPLLASSIYLARPECHVALLRAFEQDSFITVGLSASQVVVRLRATPNFMMQLARPSETLWQTVQRWHHDLPDRARHPHLEALVTQGPNRWFRTEEDLATAYHGRLVELLQSSMDFFVGKPASWSHAYEVIAPIEKSSMLRNPFERADVIAPQLTAVVLELGFKHYALRVWEMVKRSVDECNCQSWADSKQLKPELRYAKQHAMQAQRSISMVRAATAVAQARKLFHQDFQGPYRSRDTTSHIKWDWEFERFQQVINVAHLLRDFRTEGPDVAPMDYKRQVRDHLAREIIKANMPGMTTYLLYQTSLLIRHEEPKIQQELRADFLAKFPE